MSNSQNDRYTVTTARPADRQPGPSLGMSTPATPKILSAAGTPPVPSAKFSLPGIGTIRESWLEILAVIGMIFALRWIFGQNGFNYLDSLSQCHAMASHLCILGQWGLPLGN